MINFKDMFKGLPLSLVLLLCVSLSYAQEYDYVLPDSLPKQEKKSSVSLPIKPREAQPTYFVPSYLADQENNEMNVGDEDGGEGKKSNQNRTSVNLEIGTSVASDFNGNTAINTYAAPHIRHQLNDRLAISGGVVMSQTFFDGWTNYSIDGTARSMPSSVNTNMVYGRLEYQLNEKMLVYGSVYSNLTTVPGIGQDQRLQGMGYTVGMEYRMSERSFIQIQVSRSTGYNPFVPYNSFGFGSRPISYFP